MAVAVLISIQPKWCARIANGEKTIDVRKTCPTIQTPFKCYIYCTKAKNKNEDLWSDARIEPILQDGEERWQYVEGSMHYMNGTVIGEFVCDKIDTYLYGAITKNEYWITGCQIEQTCMNYDDLQEYGKGKPLYGWHISDLKIYGQPKKLDEFFYPECTNERHCDNCASCVDLGREYGYECSTSGYRRVTRAPQSWCYVEELED